MCLGYLERAERNLKESFKWLVSLLRFKQCPLDGSRDQFPFWLTGSPPIFTSSPGCLGHSDQRRGSSEVAELHIFLCAHEGQPTGVWHQPQSLSGDCHMVSTILQEWILTLQFDYTSIIDSLFQMDPSLELYRRELVVEAGRKLDKARMIRFEERTGYFASTDLGRTASHFYIKYNTIEVQTQSTKYL